MSGQASVEIVISAITEAAEQALESVGDELTSVGAQAAPAQATLDEFADELDDVTTSGAVAGESMDEASMDAAQLSAMMWTLRRSVDEAGDEMTETAVEAGTMGNAFGFASVEAGGLSVGLTALSSTLTTSLLPALALLPAVLTSIATLLAAAAAAVGGLVVAFGAVIGTGIVAYLQQLEARGESLSDVLGDLREELARIATREGAAFAELIRDTIQAIPQFVQNIFDAIGGLDRFARTLREWGQLAMTAIPNAVGALVELGRMALPAVRNLISYLQANGQDIFNALVRTLRKLGPEIVSFAQAFARAAPGLLRMGNLIMQIMVPALTLLTGILSSLTRIFNALPISGTAAKFAVFQAALAPAISSLQVLQALAFLIPQGIRALGDAIEWLAGKVEGLDEALQGVIPDLQETLRLATQVVPAGGLAQAGVISATAGGGGGGGSSGGGGGLSALERRRQLRNNPRAEREIRMGGRLTMEDGELAALIEEFDSRTSRRDERSLRRNGAGG